jgi:uncharacterized membrane protein HdeD (DUF308 family)
MAEQTMSKARGVNDLPEWVRRSWIVPLILGIVLVVVGVILLVDTQASINTLQWLIVFSLIMSGIEAFATASLRSRPWVGWVVGLVLIVGAVVAIAWPGVTLLALVLSVGVSLLVGGLVRALMSWQMRDTAEGWGWSFASGLLSVVAGLVFLLGSPIISLTALAIVLAVYVLMTGFTMVGVALAVRRLTHDIETQLAV